MSEVAGARWGMGLDAGSTTAKLALVDGAGELRWCIVEPSDPRMEAQAERLVALALHEAGLSDVPLVATGYGRTLVRPARRKITEITCHARGVFQATGHGGTLVDIGGQDSKVIVLDAAGRVDSFAMNDKCAAGTGRFIEVVAHRLLLDLDAFSAMALAAASEVPISSTCTVFAESEMVSLIASGQPIEPIVRGLLRSLVQRIVALVRSAGVRAPVMLSGGVARSGAVRQFLEDALNTPVIVPDRPQLMGAYGAALLARDITP